MATTMMVEVLLIILEYRFASKKLDVRPKYFSKQNIIYLVLSALFIPIALLVKAINFGFALNTIIIIVLCVALYGGVLLIIKDENVYLIINKFLGKLRRKKNA